MDLNDREILEKTLAVAEENNRMLKTIYRAHRLSTIKTILYWVFVVAAIVFIYYVTQPYLAFLKELLS